MNRIRIKRALISVSDKTGLVELGQALRRHGVEIISTGGTARALNEAGLDVVAVSEITGHPEVLEGRVKTLHPAIHAALLARRETPADMKQLEELRVTPIDLVVVNLYPFEKTIAANAAGVTQAVENIDIGGPTMLRASAKNFNGVTVVCDPADYAALVEEMNAGDGLVSHETRMKLAAKAFAHTAGYDAAISQYFAQLDFSDEKPTFTAEKFPRGLSLQYQKSADLRYGENPHQDAAVYRDFEKEGESLVEAEQIQGKALSFNNYMDLEGAWQLASEFRQHSKPFCAIIKHANPCGAGYGESAAEAFKAALAGDPVSAFGGIIAFNCPVDLAAAEEICGLFAECLIAPAFSEDALKKLGRKKNLRIMRSPLRSVPRGFDIRKISGGLLLADYDFDFSPREEWTTATKRTPTAEELDALEFAWKICKHVKSNAIVYSNAGRVLGVGAGQMSRVDSATIAGGRFNKDEVEGPVVMASDAFFPFRDGLDIGVKAGATAVIQPGGSKRDSEVIKAADEHGIAMVFTGRRHFRH